MVGVIVVGAMVGVVVAFMVGVAVGFTVMVGTGATGFTVLYFRQYLAGATVAADAEEDSTPASSIPDPAMNRKTVSMRRRIISPSLPHSFGAAH